ncbi:MAG: FxsA family protein [Paracoccaceae bacterium]
MWLFLAFALVPLIEIGLFIQVGGLIGLWPTLGLVLLTAAVGMTLMRSQGAAAMQDLRRSLEEMSDPGRPLAHGAMILFAGALLLTPGFFTDGLGIALLIPKFRDLVLSYISKRVKVQSFSMGGSTIRGAAQDWPEQDWRDPRAPDIIDAEEIDDIPPSRPGDSGWTRH